MGKLVIGPCWTDVTTLWWEIEKAHSCSISVLLDLDGSVGGCGVFASAVALKKRPVSLEDAALAHGTMRYPHREAATFEIGLFKLLYSLEHLIGAAEKVKNE